jgi:methyltransferase
MVASAGVLDTRLLFIALFVAVGLERLLELALSRRNARRALARGAVEAESRGFFALMAGIHAAFLVAAPLEVVRLGRPFVPLLAGAMLTLAAGAMVLRYWAIATLGERWNTRVLVVPGDPLVTAGPYRFVRHPNYLAVIVEMAALPLVHTAWLTALVFSAANALLLRARIRHEELALARLAGPAAAAPPRPRFLPGLPGQPGAR